MQSWVAAVAGAGGFAPPPESPSPRATAPARSSGRTSTMQARFIEDLQVRFRGRPSAGRKSPARKKNPRLRAEFRKVSPELDSGSSHHQVCPDAGPIPEASAG